MVKSLTSKRSSKAKSRRATLAPTSFALTFDKLEDPAPDLVNRLVQRLKAGHFGVESIVPGAFRVRGSEKDLAQVVSDLSDWTLAPEGRLTHGAPSRSKIRSTG